METRPSLPRLLLSLGWSPRATLRRAREGGWFDWRVGLAILVGYSAVEAATWVLSGIPRNGEALRVLFVDELFPEKMRHATRLAPLAHFAVLWPLKVAGDLALVTASHHLARRLGATRGTWREWLAAYGYLVGILDLYFIWATSIAILPGERAMAVSHVLLAMTITVVIMVYTWAYAEIYGLDDDRAYRGFFLFLVGIPAALLAPAALLLPAG
ncbi:MAG: hypothetical protein HY558_01625 [Euryarchaeota archaeon]|nr:hypothetical protein [Euryarchaeota archaeon]